MLPSFDWISKFLIASRTKSSPKTETYLRISCLYFIVPSGLVFRLKAAESRQLESFVFISAASQVTWWSHWGQSKMSLKTQNRVRSTWFNCFQSSRHVVTPGLLLIARLVGWRSQLLQQWAAMKGSHLKWIFIRQKSRWGSGQIIRWTNSALFQCSTLTWYLLTHWMKKESSRSFSETVV